MPVTFRYGQFAGLSWLGVSLAGSTAGLIFKPPGLIAERIVFIKKG
jgi:hypothetical protein